MPSIRRFGLRSKDPSVAADARAKTQTFYVLRGVLIAIAIGLAGCANAPKSGGYYQNDGPPARGPGDVAATADALPQVEPIRAATARPYTTLGRSYAPMTDLKPYREHGLASWYGRQFHGQKTAGGEVYDMFAMTAAHKTLPIPSYARVTNVRNSRSVIVRINDRGPFHDGRIIDLSYAAAVKLAGPNVGTQEVEVELLLPDEIARIRRDATLARATPGVVPVAQTRDASATGEAASVAIAAPIPPAVAPSAPAPTRSDAPQPGGTTVQLGAFSQRANAQALRDRIVRERPELAQRCDVVLRDNLFRLQVGPYADAIEAQAQAAELRTAFGTEALVVERR